MTRLLAVAMMTAVLQTGALAADMRGVSPRLQSYVSIINKRCGSRVISGYRYTNVAGTRTLSLHASGRAVDIRGNPRCIYRMLRNFPGGYTTDYSRVGHVHMSLGGREDGLRFRH